MTDFINIGRLPEINFEGIAQLPALAEEARQREATKQTLAGMKSASIGELESRGSQLLAQGNIDAGMKLLSAAATRRQIEQRGAMDAATLAWIQSMRGQAPPGTAPAAGPSFDPLAGRTPPTAAPTAPWTGPQGAIPTPAPPSPPGPQSALPSSPSEELLASAEGGAPTAPPPVQLAQVGGPVPIPPGPYPFVAPQPDWLAGAAAPAFRGPPQPVSQTSQGQPRGLVPQVTSGETPEVMAARQEAIDTASKMQGAGRGALSTPLGAALMRQFTGAMARAKADKDEISYQQERLRRFDEGKPDISRQDFQDETKTKGERYQAFVKTWQGYESRGEAAKGLGEKLDQMREILDNPKFAPGDAGFAKWMDSARNQGASIIQTMKAAGIPVPVSDEFIRNITEPTALREAFRSVTNLAVTTGLGGLSKSISDADRNFLSAAYPALMQTKEGAELVHKYLTESAKRTRVETGYANQYARENETGARATAWGLHDAVNEKMEKYGEDHRILKNKDGSNTALGQQMQDELAKRGVPVVGPTAPTAPTPPSARQVAPRITPADEGRRMVDDAGNEYVVRNGAPILVKRK